MMEIIRRQNDMLNNTLRAIISLLLNRNEKKDFGVALFTTQTNYQDDDFHKLKCSYTVKN